MKMRQRRSLRFRVAFAFAAFGAVVSLLLAVGLYFAARGNGQRLIDETLRAELDDYMARRARNPSSLPPSATSLQGYVDDGTPGRHAIPEPVRSLATGVHEIELNDEPYRVAVADRGGERFYILFNESRQQARERRFAAYLSLGALIMTLFSAGGGWWLASRVIAPVTDLAMRVRSLDASARPDLSSNQPHDEVGDLARAFDRYLVRLHGFIDRERAFTADVSHELRTPVASIQGAVEVMQEDEALRAAHGERIERILRGARHMTELIDALLLLAREESDARMPRERVDVGDIVKDSIERNRYLLRNLNTRVVLDIRAALQLNVERVLLSVVVANLVRNAFSYTRAGEVRVILEPDRLLVSDTGIGIDSEDLDRVFHRYYRGSASQGAGIGLSIVKRICDRYGWSIAMESHVGQGTTAQLILSQPAVLTFP